ncbi:MAG: class IV adenylate cyclase [Candidatus Verstraetearchaeota archaeon]|nr:class IV adenylate cyclase [Candidatus Verstraetearchaeota archaeon]
MGREVEVKAEVEEDLSEKITEAGGRYLREVFQEDFYFRHPCRDLAERDEALRLRREGEKYTLTFKGRRVGTGTKMREEIEVGVSDLEGAVALLERLGFEKAFVIRKRRREFLMEGVLVSMDDVEGLGRFVEIEVLMEGESLEHAGSLKDKLFEISQKLGIDREKLTTESYLEMLVSKSSSSKHRR